MSQWANPCCLVSGRHSSPTIFSKPLFFRDSMAASAMSRCALARVGAVRCAAMAVALLLSSSVTAAAAPLGVGGLLFPAPAEPDPTGGVLVAGGVPVPFASINYSGTLTSSVIAGDPSNPFGGLTFTYLLASDASSINFISRLTVNGYQGFLTDASYQAPPGGVLPAYVDRLTADVVGFSFVSFPIGAGLIAPGTHSALLVVQTDAPAFTTSFASVIDGTVVSPPTYGPIPEPATAVFVLSLLILQVRTGRRPRRTCS